MVQNLHPASLPKANPATNTDLIKVASQEASNYQNGDKTQRGIVSRPFPIESSTNLRHGSCDTSTIPFNFPNTSPKQTGIAEAIEEGMEAARLPTPHLTMFSGNSLDWPTWKVAFETVIEKRTNNSKERILYLLQYLSGPPKKIVEGYQFLHAESAYVEAKKTLERRFGHPAVVAETFRKKLEQWRKLGPRDGSALREYANFLKTCELVMQSVEDLETLDNQHDNKQLIKFLPCWIHPKWGVKVREY